MKVALAALASFWCMGGAIAQTAYFEDFNDGVADGWLPDQGIWSVESQYYHGTGQLVNGRILNVSAATTFGGNNVSIQAMMHSDAGFDDVSKMLVSRYKNPTNFLWVNFVASDRRYMILEQVVNGTRTMLIPEGSVLIAPNSQTDWHHCRYDIDGQRVIAYFDGIEVYNKNVSGVLDRSGSVGVCTYSSPGGGNEEVFVDDFRGAFFDYVSVASFAVGPGSVTNGSLAALQESDNGYLTTRPGLTFSVSTPPMQVVLSGNTPILDSSEFRFKLESAVSVSNVRQTVDLWNYQTGVWEQVDTRVATLSDFPLDIMFTDTSRFIDQATGNVRAKVSFRAQGAVFSYPWTARIDYAAWTVVQR